MSGISQVKVRFLVTGPGSGAAEAVLAGKVTAAPAKTRAAAMRARGLRDEKRVTEILRSGIRGKE